MSFVREQDAMTAIASKIFRFLRLSQFCHNIPKQKLPPIREPASSAAQTCKCRTRNNAPWVPLEGFPWKGSAPRVLLGFPGKQYQYKSGFARTPSCAAMSLTIFGVIWHLSRISQCYGWYGSDWLI